MRQLLIDELSVKDATKLNDYLKTNAVVSSVEGLYWVEIIPDLLDPDQYQAKEEQPFCFAVEVGESWAKFELLIRSQINFRSSNNRYANEAQQKFILNYAQGLIEHLDLRT